MPQPPATPVVRLPTWEWALLLMGFLAWIGSPAVAGLLGLDGGGTALQNKSPAPFPRLQREAVAEATWGPRFEAWLDDHLPLRDRWLRLDHHLDVYGWHDSPVPEQVVVGRDGFLWTRERIYGPRSGPRPSAAAVLQAVDRLQAVAHAEGLELRVVISPNKATLYPAKLPPGYGYDFVTTVLPEMQALERAARRPGSALVDVTTPLRAERDRLADPTTPVADPRLRTVFRRSDRHWSVEAGQLQARAILEALPGATWQPALAPVVGTTYTELESELSSIYLKVGHREPYTTLRVAEALRLQKRMVGLDDGYQLQRYFHLGTRGLPVDPRHLVVVRDSFLNYRGDAPRPAHGGGILALASHFRTSTFIHQRSVAAPTPEVLAAARGADLVVVQIVQGNASQLIHDEAALVALLRAAGEPRGPRQ